MTGNSHAFAQAAHSLLGSRFRLHGRDPANGIDCIGLVVSALNAIGRNVPVSQEYGLRNLNINHLLPSVIHAGFEQVTDAIAAGDLLLLKPATGQFHLVIAALGGGFLHAHAGLGRTVHTPGQPDCPIIRQWRLRQS